jgi:hypothetical protein
MRPKTIGRVLGIGVRLTGRAVAKGLEGPAQPANGAGVLRQSGAQAAGRATGNASRGIVKGVRGFLRPFGHVGGIVWLEVMGVFFLLPVIVFTPTVWRTRMSWAHGPDHRAFVASSIMVAVFLYLGISSFLRARRRAKA